MFTLHLSRHLYFRSSDSLFNRILRILMRKWKQIIALMFAVSGVTLIFEGTFVDNRRIAKILSLFPAQEADDVEYFANAICDTVPLIQNVSVKVSGEEILFEEGKTSVLPNLNVFVVLHSHVDPGWLKTFDEYYDVEVRQIIDNVVRNLMAHRDLKFIWSEISFLERWWTTTNETSKANFVTLLEEGRLEIPGGSWVMTDEATPYFWSSIDNMIIGHQFLLRHLNVTSNTSWSVDPFGHGLMMPYLLKLSGIDYMVIGRIHSLLKDKMKKEHRLNFRWVQPWDAGANLPTVVDVLPNLYYTTINACGPDETVCCQLDVVPSTRFPCARARATDDPTTIKYYADAMAGQYRALQPYYNSESLLIAAGDDFTYAEEDDLPTIQRVYSALFRYINSHPEYNMKVQFGTVSDYFKSLKNPESLGLLTGDFFPYLDREIGQPYWTGFYNQRPYHKRLERIIQSKLRLLDLLSVIARAGDITAQNEISRRDLALFQHHDAITGTSNLLVMLDYLFRLQRGLENIILEQESFIGTLAKSKEPATFSSVDSPAHGRNAQLLPQKRLKFSKEVGAYVVSIVNQQSIRSRQLISVKVNEVTVEVTHKGVPIAAQLTPFFDGRQIYRDIYTLSFYITLNAFSMTEVLITKTESQPSTTALSSVSAADDSQISAVFPRLAVAEEFLLSNDFFTLGWDLTKETSGRILMKGAKNVFNLSVSFAKQFDFGGPYVMNTRKSLPLEISNSRERSRLILAKGPLYGLILERVSEEVTFSMRVALQRSATARALQLELWPNVTKYTNATLLMRLQTSALNLDRFFTDVNGLYLMERRHNPELPFEGNVYPMATALVIEDSDARWTLLGAQPTGGTSSVTGAMDILVDRQLETDDGKGVGPKAGAESYPSQLKYHLVMEGRKKVSDHETIYHSAIAHHSFNDLLYPPTLFYAKKLKEEEEKVSEGLLPPLPCNIQLINMRYISKDVIIVLLRRLPFDCSVSETTNCNTDTTSVADFFMAVGGKIYSTNLTGTSKGASLKPSEVEATLLTPLHIVSFMVELTNNP